VAGRQQRPAARKMYASQRPICTTVFKVPASFVQRFNRPQRLASGKYLAARDENPGFASGQQSCLFDSRESLLRFGKIGLGEFGLTELVVDVRAVQVNVYQRRWPAPSRGITESRVLKVQRRFREFLSKRGERSPHQNRVTSTRIVHESKL
jgi:hypothetical protein